mmetsp:Transcript_34140/g.72604  ORF Transcript_34140/g.72604 Transcript_34140/m.72604 type:complete len:361 (+) Transcript_34140:96-1178(+)
MGCLPCCLPGPSALDVYQAAGDIRKLRDDVFVQKDLPLKRSDLALDEEGWPGVLGRWTPSTSSSHLSMPVTVITAAGTYGGTAGPRRGRNAHHLTAGSGGIFDHLAEHLPQLGVSVLQVTYGLPGNHRFQECVNDVTRAARLAAERGYVVLIGHSMGGAVVLQSSCSDSLPPGRVLGVSTLCGQTRHMPSTQDLKALASSGWLVVHGLADSKLPARCAKQIWARLEGGDEEPFLKASSRSLAPGESRGRHHGSNGSRRRERSDSLSSGRARSDSGGSNCGGANGRRGSNASCNGNLNGGTMGPGMYQNLSPVPTRRLVFLEGTGHSLVECGHEIELIIMDWVEALCSLPQLAPKLEAVGE